MNKLLYLAYGSNLHPYRLQKRVPSAHFQDTVTLSGWLLQFHKRGQDGSAKCNIIKSVSKNSKVYGALYVIDAQEREFLDNAEGLGRGYDHLDIQHPKYGSFFCYVASPTHIVSSLKPFSWYKDYVCRGAQYHDFPSYYIDTIKEVTTIADKNRCRCQENEAVLERMQIL